MLGVLVEEVFEDLAGLDAVLREEVLALTAQPLSALAPGAQGCVERQMAEQIERVRVGLAGLFGEVLVVDAALL